MNKKTIGIILLWMGFVSGALATVWNAPTKGVEFARSLRNSEQAVPVEEDVKRGPDGWHLINWTWYGFSLAVGITGIILIRISVGESAKKSDKTKASLAEIKASLNRLVVNVEQLAKESKELPPSKILSRIDGDLADDFIIFADGYLREYYSGTWTFGLCRCHVKFCVR